MQVRKKNQKPERVTKPFIRGKMIDRTLPGASLKFFAFTMMMLFLYFMSMVITSMGMQFLVVVINAAILFTTWLIFWQSGLASGTDAVSQGEIMYQRREKGRPVADWEAEQCYHPLKGLIIALVGSIPLLVCSIILAVVAEKQMTAIGVLPSWVSAYEGRPEIGGALSYYHQQTPLELETVMRVIIHVATMPYISIVGADNWDAVLVLERISPLLNLMPALSYGVGYIFGTQERAAVHGNIALGKKKQRQKQQKELRARKRRAQQGSRGPGQLN